MRKEENLTHMGHIEGKSDRKQQETTYLANKCEWMAEWDAVGWKIGEKILRATRHEKFWRAIIFLKRRTTWKNHRIRQQV